MNCEESRIYLAAYLDDELDVGEMLEMQRHLADCAGCREAERRDVELRSAVRGANLYAQPTAALKGRVDAAVRRAARSEEGRFDFSRWVTAAAAMAAVALLAVILVRSPREDMASAVLASHIRSLQAEHLVDVPSSDRHTVKPWFQGKLDFSPPVPDLSNDGWNLIGGRMDYLNRRAVASLIYQRGQHKVNVFIWPDAGGDRPVVEKSEQGYNILSWNHAGMAYWAVSDLNRGELNELARKLME